MTRQTTQYTKFGVSYSISSRGLLTTLCFSTCNIFYQTVRSTKFHQLLVICDSFCSWMATNLIHNCNLIMTQKIMSWQPLHLRCQNLEILTFFQSIDPKNWFSIEFWFLLESLWLFCVFIISKLWKILLIDDWAMPDLKKNQNSGV